MHTPLKDFPNQTVSDRASESGKLEAAFRQWAREVAFAIRALQNQTPAPTTAQPQASAASSTAPVKAVQSVPSVSWGRITGTLESQADLKKALDGREPAFGTPTSPNSIPVYQIDGSRSWSVIPNSGFIVSTAVALELGASHGVVVVSAGAPITLPKAINYKNKTFSLINSDVLPVTITPFGTETISGAATVTLAAQWESVSIISDGTQWLRYT